MKNLVLAAALVLSTSAAFAQDIGNIPAPHDYPSESDWAIGMVEQACHIRVVEGANVAGRIARQKSGSYVFRIVNLDTNRLVAAAYSKSLWPFSKKTCAVVWGLN